MASPYADEVLIGSAYYMDRSREQVAVVVGHSLSPPLVVVDIYKRSLRAVPADGSTFRPLLHAGPEQGPLFKKGGA